MPLSGILTPCLKDIFSAGSARFFQKLADFLKRYVLNSLVLYFLGSPGLSVLTACNSLLFFSTSVTNGGSDAFLSIVGSLYGEKDYYGIRQCIKSAMKFVLAGSAVLLIVLFAFPGTVGQAYGLKSAETAGMAPTAFRMLSFAFPLMGLNTLLQTIYNTTGRHKIASAMSFLSEMVYMCLFCLLFGLINKGLIWLCYPASYLASLLTASIYAHFIHKKEGVSGYLLLKQPAEGEILSDVTIHATKEEAVGLSEQIIRQAAQLGLNERQANLLGIVVLKRIVKSAEYARQLGFNTVVLKF